MLQGSNFDQIMSFHPNYHVIAPNIKTYAKYGFRGMYSEDTSWAYINLSNNEPVFKRYHNDMVEYRGYMTMKLLWDPNQNSDYLEDDFLYGYYGPSAAPYVKQILNETKDLMLNDFPKNSMRTYHKEMPDFIPEEFIDHIKRLWDMAIKASKNDAEIDPRYIYNVKMSQLSSLYVQYVRNLRREKKPQVINGRVTSGCNEKAVYAAKTILERCPGQKILNETSKGVCALSLKGEWEKNIRADLKSIVEGDVAQTIKSGQITAVSAEKAYFYGKVISLKKGNTEFLNSEEGIYFNYILECKYIHSQVPLGYVLQSKTDTITVYKIEEVKSTTTRTYTVTNDGLKVDINYKRKDSGPTMRPLFMITLDLGFERFISYKVGNGNWKSYELQDNMEFDHVGATINKNTKISICNPVTKKGIVINCPSNFESFVIHVNRTSQKVRVSFVGEYIAPPKDYNINHNFVILPYDQIPDAPVFQGNNVKSTRDPKIKYGYAKGDKIVLPDFMWNYVNQNWRTSVSDSESPTGMSMKLTQSNEPQILYYAAHEWPWYFLRDGNYTASMNVKCVNVNNNKSLAGFYGFVHDTEIEYTIVYGKPSDFKENTYREIKLINPFLRPETHFIISNKYGGCKFLHLSQLTLTVIDPPIDHVLRTWPEVELEKMEKPKEEDYNQTDDKSEEGKSGSKKWIAGVVVGVILVIAVIAIVVFIILKKRKENDDDPSEKDELQMSVIV